MLSGEVQKEQSKILHTHNAIESSSRNVEAGENYIYHRLKQRAYPSTHVHCSLENSSKCRQFPFICALRAPLFFFLNISFRYQKYFLRIRSRDWKLLLVCLACYSAIVILTFNLKTRVSWIFLQVSCLCCSDITNDFLTLCITLFHQYKFNCQKDSVPIQLQVDNRKKEQLQINWCKQTTEWKKKWTKTIQSQERKETLVHR